MRLIMLNREVTVYKLYGKQQFNEKEMTLAEAHDHLLNKENIGSNLRYTHTLSGNPEMCVGVCEMWGERDYEEDAVLGDLLQEGANSFNPKDWEDVITASCKETETLLRDHSEDASDFQGSCFIGNIITNEYIYNFNLGDSETWLVGSGKAKRINNLHDCNNKFERTRITNLGGNISYGGTSTPRVEGILAVTRAIGDNAFNIRNPIISHEPEFIKSPIQDNDYLVIACDGFREGLAKLGRPVEKTLADKLTEYQKNNFSPERMAVELAELAYRSGSRDNISVVVIPLSKIASLTKRFPLFYFVADGHAGHAVSDFLFKNFIRIFQQKIQERIELKARESNSKNEQLKQSPAPVKTNSTTTLTTTSATSNNRPSLTQTPKPQTPAAHENKPPLSRTPAPLQKTSVAASNNDPKSQANKNPNPVPPSTKTPAKDNKKAHLFPNIMAATNLYLENKGFFHSREHSADRLRALVDNYTDRTYTKEEKIKLLKAEYEALIDYDINSGKMLYEGPVARAIRDDLKNLGEEDPRKIFFPLLPLEALTTRCARQLLNYIDETERSFSYKISVIWGNGYYDDYDFVPVREIAHKLVLCKDNADLAGVSRKINTELGKKHIRNSHVKDMLESISRDIDKRLKKQEVSREWSNENYNGILDKLNTVRTSLQVTPNRFTKEITTDRKPLLIDELTGKLKLIQENPDLTSSTKFYDIKKVIKQTQRKLNRSTLFFGLFSGCNPESKFKEVLTDLRSTFNR